MTPQELYEANLALIDRAVGFVCRRNHLPGPEAEDFGQSVHVKLMEDDFKVFRSFKGEASLKTYLIIVVQRHLVDRRRRAWGKNQKEHGPVDDKELDEQPASVERPEGDILESELQPMHERLLTALEKALGELPADDRLLVEMCTLRGRTIADAARFLGLPQKPLYRRQPQILARLRKALEAEGFTWEQVSEILGISEVRWD